MKTLVVLSALAAVALAAPTLPEGGSEDFNKFIPEIFKRERKSAQEFLSDTALTPTENQPPMPHISEFGVSGRSFGLKKPIIIKKKPLEYHVYRDSGEVPAESGETCGSHVKVKFCDNKNKLKSSTIQDKDIEMTEEDMKNSISLAKEAIENLQRDLSSVERKPGTQASSWNHGHSESDVELHQDIEVAREALEHIHKNFGNFESMSLHSATLKEADTAPFTMAKNEEQRLAQWKEAINNMQKNAKIAQDIEDSFKTESHDDTTAAVIDEKMLSSDKNEEIKKTDNNLQTSEDLKINPNLETSENDLKDHKMKSESCKAEHATPIQQENTKDSAIENDMTSSASTISEKTVKDQTKHTSLLGKMASSDTPWNSEESETMKFAGEVEEDKSKKTQLSENLPKSIETEDVLMQNQKKIAEPGSSEKIESDSIHKMHPDMKPTEDFDNNKKEEIHQDQDLQTGQSKQIETMLFLKSAEEEQKNMNQELKSEVKTPGHMVASNPESLSVGTSKEDLKTEQEMITTPQNEGQMESQKPHSMTQTGMGPNENMKNEHQELIMDPQTRWAQEKNLQMQRESMTSATGLHSHMVQHPGHTHHVTHGMKNHHFEPTSALGFQSRFPENFLTQEKSADPEMQAYYMSMRDGMGLMPENHRFRWKPNHEAPRTAYGAPSVPAAGGAVGVFPNANLGSCGIPLLLSCNPSVVSGSLAKPPASYSAPAYRTEDDFTFHTKRDVKKTQENLSTSLHKMSKGSMKTKL